MTRASTSPASLRSCTAVTSELEVGKRRPWQLEGLTATTWANPLPHAPRQQKAPPSRAALTPDPTCRSAANCPSSWFCFNPGTQSPAPRASWLLSPSCLSRGPAAGDCSLPRRQVPAPASGVSVLSGCWKLLASDSAVICKGQAARPVLVKSLLLQADHGNLCLELSGRASSCSLRLAWPHYIGSALLESELSVPRDDGARHWRLGIQVSPSSTKGAPHPTAPCPAWPVALHLCSHPGCGTLCPLLSTTSPVASDP